MMVSAHHEKRLLVILNRAAHNGAVRQMSLWLPSLDPKSWRIRMVFLRDAGPLSSAIIPQGAYVNEGILNRRFDPLVMIRLLRITLRFRPDIIFTIDERNAMILARFAGIFAGSSVIHAIHSTPSPENTKLPWWDRMTSQFVSHVVAVTETQRRILELIGIPRDRIRVVLNAVPSVEEEPIDRDSSSMVTAAFVGVLRKEKRVDLLLRAFASIGTKFPYLRLSVIGNGPLEWSLKELARDLGIDDRVTWHGWQFDVTPFLRTADYLVLSSDPGVETLSMAVLEAMSLGLPVITTDVGSMRMAVVPETGIVVPSGNVDALAAAMERLTSDDSTRIRMGKEAHLRQQRLFTIDRLRDDMNHFLDAVIRQRSHTCENRWNSPGSSGSSW